MESIARQSIALGMIPPRFEINLIVDDKDNKKKKVYNLNKSKKIILNPSFLASETQARKSSADTPSGSTSPRPPCMKLSKLKKTNSFSMGSANKEEENTFCPSRRSSSRIWNRFKGSWTIRSGKSITLDAESKVVKISPEKDSTSSETETDSESSDINQSDVEHVLKDVLRKKLHDLEYDHERCKDQSAQVSLEIHDRVKEMTHGVYKIAVNVFLGEVRGEGVETSTQCTWNSHQDCFVTGYFKNTSIIGFATVFASYSA